MTGCSPRKEKVEWRHNGRVRHESLLLTCLFNGEGKSDARQAGNFFAGERERGRLMGDAEVSDAWVWVRQKRKRAQKGSGQCIFKLPNLLFMKHFFFFFFFSTFSG